MAEIDAFRSCRREEARVRLERGLAIEPDNAKLRGLLDSLIKLKERIAIDSRSARHGLQTGAGIGVAHDAAPPELTPR